MKKTILELLDLEKFKAISIIGAGGKTTLMNILAREFKGLEVSMTTTTKIYKPSVFSVDYSKENMEKVFNERFSMTFGEDFHEKLSKPSDEFFEYALNYCDKLIIEADGSNRLPIKCPNETEPVYAKNTDCVIAVLGLSAISKKLKICCHRHDLACEVLGKSEEDIVTANDIITLLTHENGIFRNCPNVCKKIVLNQIDMVRDIKEKEIIYQFVSRNKEIIVVNLNDYKGENA